MKELSIEKKSLLLKDLCARLPYEVFISYNDGVIIEDRVLGLGSLHDFMFNNAMIMPYLRPMSSMTEEEIGEFEKIVDIIGRENEIKSYDTFGVDAIDYLLAHHFDVRNLLEKGLALEVHDGVYNLKGEQL